MTPFTLSEKMNNINQTIHELKIMDLTQLHKMFNAVALTERHPRAAASTSRSVNLTTRIRQLESRHGHVSLFIRENQRLRLSPAGHNTRCSQRNHGAG